MTALRAIAAGDVLFDTLGVSYRGRQVRLRPKQRAIFKTLCEDGVLPINVADQLARLSTRVHISHIRSALFAASVPVAIVAKRGKCYVLVPANAEPERPPARMLSVEDLNARYGLTVTEAEIAQQIGMGWSGKKIAACRGATYLTVKTHLKTIFKKTRVHRQAELALLVVGGLQ
jgi:DNA-binding CsgD family transcriptional regulator